jgi:hypothetical protein
VILNLDANGVGGGQMADYKGDAWPKDLLITNVSQCAIQDLQVYSKANRTPFALFVPHNSPGGSDQGNLTRYTNMAKSLYAGGQVCFDYCRICSSQRLGKEADDRWPL